MSDNKAILEKAIQKAIDGGWDTTHFHTTKGSYKHPDESEFHDILGDWHKISPLDIIFNHDFAKALWGEEVNDKSNGDDHLFYAPWWKYHLSHMVISDDPIKYLGDNI
jgi:hypothetical protein